MATNAVTAFSLIALLFLFGFAVSASVFFPVLLTAASVGVWLFYLQHQFEDAHWDKGENWPFYDTALHESSHVDLLRVLRWFNTNIGMPHGGKTLPESLLRNRSVESFYYRRITDLGEIPGDARSRDLTQT